MITPTFTPRATSDANGNFSIWLFHQTNASESYVITLTAPTTSEFSTTTFNAFQIGQAGVVQDFVIKRSNKWTGTLRGLGGVALAGQSVTLTDMNANQVARTQTDITGAFQLNAPPGQYRMYVNGSSGVVSICTNPQNATGCTNVTFPDGMPVNFTYSGSISIPDSGLAQDLQLPFVELKGRITDSNGVPVAGIAVSGAGSSNIGSAGSIPDTSTQAMITPTFTPRATSDANGNFSIWLFHQTNASESYTITVTPDAKTNFGTTAITNFVLGSGKFLTIILPFNDAVAPAIIAGPSFRSVTASSVVVEWQTDEPTKGSVSAGGVTVSDDTLATTHSLQLTGLGALTMYSAQVSAVDAAGNGPTTKRSSFQTAASNDAVPPAIVEGPTVTESTATSLVVEWTTNEPAKGTLHYGLGALGGTVEETAFAVRHRIEVGGLSAAALYSVRANATDTAGNGPTLSRIMSGSTRPAADTAAPVIVNGPLVSDITNGSATVVWKTDKPSTSGVSWNDGVAYGVLTVEQLSSAHSAQITGLAGGKTYHLTVSSKDALGNGPTLSKTVDFTTLPDADIQAPQLLAAPTIINVTEQSAVIRWDTDEPADSQIVYGTSPNTLDKIDSRAALTKTHNLPLVGLAAGTAYTFQVRSTDAAGNVSGYSAPLTFTTSSAADTAQPVFDSPPQVGYAAANRAVVQWKTDKLTDSQIMLTTFDEPPRIKNDGTLNDLHEMALTGLTANKTYSVSVTSTDLTGNTVTQSLGSFTTPATADTTAPAITEGPTAVQVYDTRAVIRWVTDELSDSRVAYGKTGTALNNITGDIAYRKEHFITLTKLTPNTAYEFQVGSIDPSGNGPTQSATLTFSTVGQGQALSYVANFAQGWTLTGNGLDTPIDVAATFGSMTVAPSVVTVWSWDATSTNWRFYTPKLSAADLQAYVQNKGYQLLTTIAPRTGFWINAASAFGLPGQSALPVVITAADLTTGWNLVAIGIDATPPEFNAGLTNAAPSTIPKNLTSLWAWDNPASAWYFYSPILEAQGPTKVKEYADTKGYFDFATQNKKLGLGTGFWVNR